MVLARKSKLVHVVRHGEAQHNVCDGFLRRHDTHLTARGRRQARSLKQVLKHLKPELAVTSDVLRALQTTQLMGFNGPVIVTPHAREAGGWPANEPIDASRAVSGDLKDQFGGYEWSHVLYEGESVRRCKQKKCKQIPAVDKEVVATTALVDPAAPVKWEPHRKLKMRAQKLAEFLETRLESNIVLVSHGEFLERMTDDTYMDNCEVRTYKLLHGKWRRMKLHGKSRRV